MAVERDQQQAEQVRTESSLFAGDSGKQWPEWLAAVVLIGAFSVSQGVTGLVAGLATVVVWAALGTPAAVAAGTVLLLVQTPDGADPLGVAVVGGGLFGLVLVPAVTTRYSTGYAAAVVLTTVVFGVLARLVVTPFAQWLTTLILVSVGLLVAYGLHRYLQLRLGLLGQTTNTEELSTDNRS